MAERPPFGAVLQASNTHKIAAQKCRSTNLVLDKSDQNPEISDYVTIYYPLRYPMVVLRNDHVLSKDASGAVEEVLANEGAHVTLMQDS